MNKLVIGFLALVLLAAFLWLVSVVRRRGARSRGVYGRYTGSAVDFALAVDASSSGSTDGHHSHQSSGDCGASSGHSGHFSGDAGGAGGHCDSGGGGGGH